MDKDKNFLKEFKKRREDKNLKRLLFFFGLIILFKYYNVDELVKKLENIREFNIWFVFIFLKCDYIYWYNEELVI